MPLLLGIDTGGTFTDAVLFDDDAGVVASAKALTTRADLAVGIAGAVDAVLAQARAEPGAIALVSLSTTLATNALVEGQGGRVGLVLIGFDESALARSGLAAALGDGPCVLVAGGHDAHGAERAPLDQAALQHQVRALEGQVSAFAVASQFAVRNAAHENAARDLILALSGRPVTCSHELSSRLDGPRRAMTCILNARLVSLIHHLIEAARGLLAARGIGARLMVVRGDGALIAADVARVRPIETILSGPAASLVGAAHLAGARDALVSDIGGTTTDFAVLQGGRPRLDPDGATVGGFRTMVEAVAMRTIGLGGDSEVRVIADGLHPVLALGPRRAIPLCLFALQYPALVNETLARQIRGQRRGEHGGRFALSLARTSAHRAALGRGESALLERLRDGPVALDRLLESQAQSAVLDRLVARGLAQLAAVTPTDAAHVLELHDAWDPRAARDGLALFAQQKGPGGRPVADDAEAAARWVVDTLVDHSAHALLEGGLRDDGRDHPGLARILLDARHATAAARVALDARLTLPLVGLGAAAAAYYPRVAESLGTTALVPVHASVANAVGAVVGRVRVNVTATLSVPQPGEYRLFLDGAPRRFSDPQAAYDHARDALEALARRRAAAAGAADVTVHHEREDVTAVVDGQVTLVESVLRATATGRPRFAAGPDR